jgi:hypothetical protein
MPLQDRAGPCAPEIRRSRATEIAAAFALAGALAAGAALTGYSMPHDSRLVTGPAQPTQEPPACGVEVHKSAQPAQIRAGETVNVTLVFTATCVSAVTPLHIVLVVDAGTTDDRTAADLQDRLAELVLQLDLDANPHIKVAVVEYADDARTRCHLTNQTSRLLGCIRPIQFEGTSRTDLGIDQGVSVLIRGRSDEATRPLEVMVVTMTGGPPNGCQPAISAAGSAKGNGVLVMSVCAGLTCDTQCARQIASGSHYAFTQRDWPPLVVNVLDQIMDQSDPAPRAVAAVVTDTLPANMAYVAGSAVPPALVRGPDLIWEDIALPPNTITLTFAILPLEAGRHPTNVEARADVFFVGHPRVVGIFPVPEVDVVAGASPTASPTRTPEDTPTPTATATPRRSWAIYLPDSRAK